MAGIDASIPLGVKVPDSMTTLGSMLGVANAATQVQGNRLNLQERNNVRALFQNPDALTDDQGNIDFNKATPLIMQAAPTQGAAILKNIIDTQKDAIAAKSAIGALSDQQRTAASTFVASLGDDAPDVAFKKMDAVATLNPQLKPALDFARKHYLEPASSDPAAFKQAAIQIGKSVMSTPQQLVASTPSGISVDNNQQSRVVNTNPGAGAIGATIPGTEVQKQLPPTTPTFEPSTKTPGYLGPQPAATVPPAVQDARDAQRLQILQAERQRELANPDPVARAKNIAALDTEIAGMTKRPSAAPSRVQSGPALGTEQNVGGTVDVVNKDWAATAESAKTANQDIGVLQNIKKFAPGAITGVGADRRQFIAGLAGLIGMDPAQMEKTNTDLLAKNTNMLALAGGDTNLAKLMAESANPNTHMTKEAIIDAANQVIAQRKLALAKQAYMGHFKGDPEAYTQELSNWNQMADPRALQYPDMNPDERARMKAAMSPTEQREFSQKMRKLQAVGVLQ